MPSSRSLTRLLVGAGTTATVLVSAACSTGNDDPAATSSGSAAGKKCTIGMAQINQTAVFFTQMNEGAKAAAKAVGCDLQIANANDDSAKQNNDIETFVTQGVTALIVVAIDVNGVVSAVKAARAKGIKTVAIDAKLAEGTVDTFVGVDNAKAGKQIADWMIARKLVSGKRYGVVDAKSSFIQNQREKSFRTQVDGAGAKYTQSVNGDNVQEKAATAAQNLVTAQPDLDFVYTTGEPATVGSNAALKSTGKTKIIGWDLTKEVIKGIDSGLVTAVVQQDPKKEGDQAVRELRSLLDGGTAKSFIDVPIAIVTKANVDPYRKIFT